MYDVNWTQDGTNARDEASKDEVTANSIALLYPECVHRGVYDNDGLRKSQLAQMLSYRSFFCHGSVHDHFGRFCTASLGRRGSETNDRRLSLRTAADRDEQVDFY